MAKATPMKFEVLSNTYVTPTVFLLEFKKVNQEGVQDTQFEFKSGQFISVVIPKAGPGGRDLRRAYSISSAPSQKTIQFCVKKVEGGPGTTYLSQLKKGDVFDGVAPYGDFVLESPPERSVMFISTGTGIAPFRSMIQEADVFKLKHDKVVCLFGVRSEDEVLYEKEMRSVEAEHENFAFCVALSRPTGSLTTSQHRRLPASETNPEIALSAWTHGRVTDFLRGQWNPDIAIKTDYYLCGSNAMIQEVKEILISKGVAKEQIFQEKYY